MSASDVPIFESTRRRTAGDRRLGAAAYGSVAIMLGLAVGVATSYGQGWLGGPLAALVNSASAWLVMPFAIGALASGRRGAATAGLVSCLLQLVGYDVCSELRGFGVSPSFEVFWALCAVIGGPLFGLAGHAWRREPAAWRGLGPATLSAAFVAEGLWTYAHQLHETGTAVLWLAIGAGVALIGLRGVRGWRWLAVTVPLGLLAEVLLTRVWL